jgi:hypothetical protein
MDIIRRIAVDQEARRSTTPPLTETHTIVASREAIWQWADRQNLQLKAFDLPRINAEARRIGHPGFVLKTGRG